MSSDDATARARGLSDDELSEAAGIDPPYIELRPVIAMFLVVLALAQHETSTTIYVRTSRGLATLSHPGVDPYVAGDRVSVVLGDPLRSTRPPPSVPPS